MAVYHPRTLVVNSGGTLVNEVIHAKPCIVHAVHAVHTSGQAIAVQIHDVAAAPPDGAVPLLVHQVGANSDATIEPSGWPLVFENGIYVCESTTIPTKTLSLSADLFVYIVIEEMTFNG